ncbi:unnamed protein product [Mytilus coruscus]|uniref:Uncharacterized protein n=1 Tax=Mytilus coruscus TaxID=42192 RepID=A0A6J8CJQ1_MYTCO|nr:unnamed protein product [Mytilus coruscus]
MASRSDVQSGHSGYPPIDVKGEIDRLLFVLPTGINYATFYPIVMRNHDEGADHKWITIRWGQGQVEILQKAPGGLNLILMANSVTLVIK